jgi:hypothetical protein
VRWIRNRPIRSSCSEPGNRCFLQQDQVRRQGTSRRARREVQRDSKRARGPANPADYSGSYEADWGFRLDLKVDAHGNVSGSGADPFDLDGQTLRTFTLADGKIDGALLTAVKVFANGARERFEGVFINETVRDNPNEAGTTTFGLGALISPRQISGVNVEKVFYEPRQ